MAHWNDERDRARVKMMRECRMPTEFIKKYEETGDIIYWDAFIEVVRGRRNPVTKQPEARSNR